MTNPRPASRFKVLAPLLLLLAALIIFPVVTANNTVQATKADDESQAHGANNIKPASCNALTLTALIQGSGVINGGTTNDLVLGANGADTMNGLSGNDCLVGGNGNDSLDGGPGTDVCIGGPGTDTFDILNSCETRIQ